MTATVGGATWSYLYDPFGRRCAKTSPTGAVTLYLHDRDDNEVGEYDGVNGLTLRENRYDPRRVAPVAMLSYANGAGNGATPVLTFNHADRLGSVVATSSAPNSSLNAVLTGQYKYDAWGQSTTLIGTGFGYAGYRYDAETGLYQTGARYYDPRLGRFLSTDPLGQGPGLNVYAYVGNDPLNNVDPLGLLTLQLGVNGGLSLFGTNFTAEGGVVLNLSLSNPQIGVYGTGTAGKSVGADAGLVIAATITPSANNITDLRGVGAAFGAGAGDLYQAGGTLTVTKDGQTSYGDSLGFGFGASGSVGFSDTKVGCVINCATGDNIVSNAKQFFSGMTSGISSLAGALGSTDYSFSPPANYTGPANRPTGPGK